MRRLSLKVDRISFDDDHIQIWLLGGGMIGVPLAWLPALQQASAKARQGWRLTGADECIEWTALGVEIAIPHLVGRS